MASQSNIGDIKLSEIYNSKPLTSRWMTNQHYTRRESNVHKPNAIEQTKQENNCLYWGRCGLQEPSVLVCTGIRLSLDRQQWTRHATLSHICSPMHRSKTAGVIRPEDGRGLGYRAQRESDTDTGSTLDRRNMPSRHEWWQRILEWRPYDASAAAATAGR